MPEKLEVLPGPVKPLAPPPPDRPAAPPPTSPPPGQGRRRGRLAAWLIVLLLLIGGGVAGWRLLHRAPSATAGRNGRNAPQTVGVASVGTGDLQVVRAGLGTVTPLATVTVKTQINGQLQEIGFQEGQIVHKGDFLFQIDPRPYQVALEQATGTLAHDQALLAQAKSDFARYSTLSKQDSIARQQVDDQQFLIKQYQGSVITDQAMIDSAKLNLTYCHIVSPVDGRVGIRLVDVGNYVQTSDAGLVVVTQLQPMSVIFTLPEDDVAEVQAQMATAQQAGAALPTTAFDRSDTKQVAAGTLATMDTEIDNTTGTVKLRALFANTDNALFPQQFVNAHLLTQTLRGVVVAPVPAVQTGEPGTFVYLVKPDSTVAIQKVTTGVTDGDRVQITAGLKAGDTVVVDGLDRLRDGARIVAAKPGDANAQPPGQQPGRQEPVQNRGRSGQGRDGQGRNGQGSNGQGSSGQGSSGG